MIEKLKKAWEVLGALVILVVFFLLLIFISDNPIFYVLNPLILLVIMGYTIRIKIKHKDGMTHKNHKEINSMVITFIIIIGIFSFITIKPFKIYIGEKYIHGYKSEQVWTQYDDDDGRHSEGWEDSPVFPDTSIGIFLKNLEVIYFLIGTIVLYVSSKIFETIPIIDKPYRNE